MLCSLNQASGNVYHIRADESTDLSTGLCLILSEVATNSSGFLHSNATLVILPGTHYLSTANLTLSNMENVIMKSEKSTAQIECVNSSYIYFSQSQFLHIAHLEFIGCGGYQVKYLNSQL